MRLKTMLAGSQRDQGGRSGTVVTGMHRVYPVRTVMTQDTVYVQLFQCFLKSGCTSRRQDTRRSACLCCRLAWR